MGRLGTRATPFSFLALSGPPRADAHRPSFSQPKDTKQAIRWFETAARRGHRGGAELLEQLQRAQQSQKSTTNDGARSFVDSLAAFAD